MVTGNHDDETPVVADFVVRIVDDDASRVINGN